LIAALQDREVRFCGAKILRVTLDHSVHAVACRDVLLHAPAELTHLRFNGELVFTRRDLELLERIKSTRERST
jgi:hypothetical protein